MEDRIQGLVDDVRDGGGIGQVRLDEFGVLGDGVPAPVREVVGDDDDVVGRESSRERGADEPRATGHEQAASRELHARGFGGGR